MNFSPDDPQSDGPRSDHDDLQQALQGVLPESAPPVIEEELLIEIDYSQHDRYNDNRLLARFFGVCVLMIGLITILPAIYYWVVTSTADQVQPVARWAYILGFLGGVHFLYALYTIQVVDYSALESLAVFLLIVTCVYGFAAMALALDEGSNGVVANFLQLPSVLKTRAMLWSGIMFGVTALGCYLIGREALIFRRRQSTY